MKLNNEKNIMLCQKALYSKQLQHYSKLCSLYSELALLKKDYTPDEIQDTYSEALSLAAKGDLSFIEPAYSNNSTTQKYSDDEIEIFEEYASYAKNLSQFKEAASILKESIIRLPLQKPELDLTVINKYKKYMESTSRSTKLFDKFIDESSPRSIGHHYYLATKNSIKKIDEIDSAHLNSKAFSDLITPSAFGATIAGFKTPEQVLNEASNIYEKSERKEYARKPNIVSEATFNLGYKSQKYTANKKAIRASIAAILSCAALLGSAVYVKNINTYNNLTSTSSEYQSYISNQTNSELQSIRTRLQTYKNSDYNSLNTEDIKKLRDDLDDVIDLVMSDLTKSAFETANPDCEVTSVETMYDRTTNQYISSTSVPNPEHFCTINYIDKNGEEKDVVVTNFNAFSIFSKNSIDLSYINEYDLDHLHVNKENLTESQLQELLNTYENILKDTEQLAGTKMVYSDGIINPSLKTVIPEKNTENNNNNPKDNKEDEIR